MNSQIIILDDTESFQTDHRNRLIESVPELKDSFELPEIPLDEFREDLGILVNRNDQGIGYRGDRETCFDKAAILFVDYRLIGLRMGFITGEEVAYHARCFSTCGLIVGLNQFGEGFFDLSLLNHPSSYADLNIGASDISNRGLWRSKPTGFRPWHWPILPDEISRFEKRITDLEDLDHTIFSFLGFEKEHVMSMPRQVLEFVTHEKTADAAWETSFREFVTKSGNGLHFKDVENTSDEIMIRVAAARIFKWLERFVLSGQNTLIDAPHLVSRYPSLLTEDAELDVLNATSAFLPLEEMPIRRDIIEDSKFGRDEWLSRPGWFLDRIKNNAAISEVSDPWSRVELEYSFCEDTSRFIETKACREFVSNLPTPHTRRYVEKVNNVQYSPELRFSL